MRCIDEEKLQLYIDNELSESKQSKVKTHLASCKVCRDKYESQLSFVSFLQEMNPEDNRIEIPSFALPSIRNKNRKKFFYPAVAACLALLLITVYSLRKESLQEEYIIFYQMEDDFDSNKPFSEQKTSLHLVDKEGNIINEY